MPVGCWNTPRWVEGQALRCTVLVWDGNSFYWDWGKSLGCRRPMSSRDSRQWSWRIAPGGRRKTQVHRDVVGLGPEGWRCLTSGGRVRTHQDSTSSAGLVDGCSFGSNQIIINMESLVSSPNINQDSNKERWLFMKEEISFIKKNYHKTQLGPHCPKITTKFTHQWLCIHSNSIATHSPDA